MAELKAYVETYPWLGGLLKGLDQNDNPKQIILTIRRCIVLFFGCKNSESKLFEKYMRTIIILQHEFPKLDPKLTSLNFTSETRNNVVTETALKRIFTEGRRLFSDFFTKWDIAKKETNHADKDIWLAFCKKLNEPFATKFAEPTSEALISKVEKMKWVRY